jgi:hypothetical protein
METKIHSQEQVGKGHRHGCWSGIPEDEGCGEEGIIMVKPSKRKVKYFIKDEKKAAKEYHHYGLHNLEKDERKHKRFLQKKLKKM